MKILHVINNLDVGGAEMMLLKLATALRRSEFEFEVLALIGKGSIGPRIEQLGIPVRALGFKQAIPRPSDLWRLRQEIARSRPDVVQSWMFHSDLLGGLASTFLRPRPPVVWNIRHSHLSNSIDKRSTILTVSLCAKLSRWLPRKIIVNSEEGRAHYSQLGYAEDKLTVVPNGFDLTSFAPDAQAGVILRREIDVPASSRLIGHVGRFSPEKDHVGFIRAAGKIAEALPEARFVMCGRDISMDNTILVSAINATGFADRFRLLGRRDDMPFVHAAFDLEVSSSISEGFPNVIGEAMACGVPCVVTDVGGSAEIVGDTGRVLPHSDPEALAAECLQVLGMHPFEYSILRQRVRERIEQKFDIHQISQVYCDLWRSVVPQIQLQHQRRAA